jgi:hypothetical protein
MHVEGEDENDSEVKGIHFHASRVADSIYWMSLYIERAENGRFVDVNLHLMLDCHRFR